MRILLSGQTGQLGRALAATLPNIGDVTAPPHQTFDLLDEASIRQTLEEIQPDLIVNAAAYTAVDKAETERAAATAVNARAPEIMAGWAADRDATILHFSTDYVFDGTATEPLKEQDPTNPINVYGITKRDGERAVSRSGARHLIVRTSWLYDAEGANFVRAILRLARERTSLQVVNDQTGAPAPAWWLAKISTQIISKTKGRFDDSLNGTLHAAPSGATTRYDFAAAIIDGARKRSIPLAVEKLDPIPSSAYPTPAARPSYAVFCLDRLRQTFGTTPPHWRDALEPVLDEIARNEDRP